MLLDKINYCVARLDGDYAYLQKEDEPDTELKCVARALLPPEIIEGSRLVYEMMEYSLIQVFYLFSNKTILHSEGNILANLAKLNNGHMQITENIL